MRSQRLLSHSPTSLNWTKVGLKDTIGLSGSAASAFGLNWTKVGLKGESPMRIRGQGRGWFELD